MSRIYLFVNGIRTFPGDSENWNGRAVTATHVNFRTDPHKAEKIEYFTFALTRGIQQSHRARKLSKVAKFYSEWEKIVVAHSNGADVVLDALRQNPFRIEHLHLVSPAIDKDCEKNGLASLMKEKWIGKLTIYIAGKDRALRCAKSWVARKLFGYGALGLDGPSNLPFLFQIVKEDNYGHSEWWTPENFPGMMERFWQ